MLCTYANIRSGNVVGACSKHHPCFQTSNGTVLSIVHLEVVYCHRVLPVVPTNICKDARAPFQVATLRIIKHWAGLAYLADLGA